MMTGEEYNKTVTSLMEMGFEKSQVERAMKAAFFNPERATDYLINVLSLLVLREFLQVFLLTQYHNLEDQLLW